MKTPALAFASLLLVGALAGCSGPGGSSDPISITVPDQPGGEYVFKANVGGDAYDWDLGDSLTKLTGKEVRHAYDVANARILVRLVVTSGTETQSYEKDLVLGSGDNSPASYLLEVSHFWAIVDETVTLSADASTDPDGDAQRYSWSCYRAKIKRADPHDDGGLGPSTAKPPEQGGVVGFVAERTLPAPTMTLDGDMCDAINAGPWPSLSATTISGKFTQLGIYTITLIASDGAHPTTSGSVKFYVTDAAGRPDPIRREHIEGTLAVARPAGQSLQTQCTSLEVEQYCDEASLVIDLPLNVKGGWVNATQAEAPTNDVNTYRWTLERGQNALYQGGLGSTVLEPKAGSIYGRYTLVIVGTQGAQIPFSVDVVLKLDMNPATVYDAA